MKRISTLAIAILTVTFGAVSAEPSSSKDILGGELRVLEEDLPDIQRFPLEQTDVRVEIAGNVARVELTQHFSNPYDKKIEAVYVFPLPNRAAVDDMEIRLGERTIKGLIKKRQEALRIYEDAKRAGHVAALLDQERPNIFTQSVANILPGNKIQVKIRYFETLPYVDNDYTFAFPMVVGPRFIPGTPTSEEKRGWSPNTTDVPDASRITPPVLEPGQRSGHDISLEVNLNAGAELTRLSSPSHQVEVGRRGLGRARIVLEPHDSIPNKDFVLRYRLDGNAPRVILLPHRSKKDGYFLMLIQPEANPAPEKITPKEIVFVVDGSGSMRGFPMAKVKEAMRHSLKNLNSSDTFQIIRFSNRAETFAPAPVSATESNIRKGLAYIETLSGRGGTIMLEGVQAALSPPDDPERLRIISFMTDGYIGNEKQILAYLQTHLGGARLFSFGVGSSVNRYLLDKMAELGRGAAQYVLLQDNAEEPVKRFYERIRNPYLTDIEINWGDLEVSDIYPKRIPDLFVGQPLVLQGKYTRPGKGKVTLHARMGGRPFEQSVSISLPEAHPEAEAIATLWARARIEELSNRQLGDPQPALEEEITRVALAHRLVSAYTSFVAVEEKIVTGSEQPVLVEVPVEMPAGVSYEGVFGGEPRPASLSYIGKAPGRTRTMMPSIGLAEDAPEAPPMRRSQKTIEPDLQRAVATFVCRIETTQSSYRVGEPIEIVVIIENFTGQTLKVPARLSVVDGTARFQVTDTEWNTLVHPTGVKVKPETIELQPGGRVSLLLVVNGAGGYSISKPGTYHLVFLGSEIGLSNSNTLTLQIAP